MEIKINSMKTKLPLYIAILTLIITGTVYAQEGTQPELPVEEVVDVPAEIEEVQEELPEETLVFKVEVVSEENLLIEDVEVSGTSSTGTSSNSTPSFTDLTLIVPDDEDSVRLLIRNGAHILFEGEVVLSELETIDVADLEGDIHTIPSNSVLGALLQVDESVQSFDVTKLKYYDSFSAFYLTCIQVDADELCENWQYVVNNTSPWTGIDQTTVSPGDSIGIYFGNPYQVLFSTSTYYVGTSFTATAQKYNYQENIWNARTGVTLGVTVSDPGNPWTPIEVITSPVNSLGEALFTIATSGEYMIGVQEDYYYPSYTITVSSTTATTTATSTDATGVSTGGGSGSVNTPNEFDIDAAYEFLKSVQASDGSFGSAELYTDWVAIALGALGKNDSSVVNYLQSKSNIKNSATDNQRRAMALLALGENPYDFDGKNYIEAIVKEFDGTQIGEKSLVNDDIFGLIVLQEAGYTQQDIEIQKTISFIIGKQNGNGSWENSVDLTSAAIQALDSFRSVSGVSSVISKAKGYLKNNQQADGGWGNVYATTWALQAMNVLSENWEKEGNSPEEYLSKSQEEDGGLLSSSETERNRIWATSYAIPAILGMSWNDILESVSKPDLQGVGNSKGNDSSSATTTQEVSLLNEQDLIGEIASVSTTTPELVQEEQKIPVIPSVDSQENLTKDDSSNVQEEIINSDQEPLQDQQVASVQNITWLKEWWGYVLAGTVALLSIFGLSQRFI